MQIIALISQKGGAGKTTLAIAVAAERAGVTSVLVDLDPQASAAQWSDLREAETPVVTCSPAARLTSVLKSAQRTEPVSPSWTLPRTPPMQHSQPPAPVTSY